MNKSISSIFFAPLLVMALGAMATTAQAGTIVISGFANTGKTMQILKKTEAVVFNGGAGNVYATCNGHKILISDSEPIFLTNRHIANACPKGDLTIFVSTIPQKVIIQQAESAQK